MIDEGLNGYRFGAVECMDALDDSTVVITLTQPSPNLLVSIAGFKGMAIIPKEIVDDGTIATHPVGTGPFRFVSSRPIKASAREEPGLLASRRGSSQAGRHPLRPDPRRQTPS